MLIEQRFPNWPEARAVIESAVPDQLTFYHQNHQILIDHRWASGLISITPPMYQGVLMRLCLVMEQKVSETVSKSFYDKFSNPSLDRNTLREMGKWLLVDDHIRKMQGLPTRIKMIRQQLGIEL